MGVGWMSLVQAKFLLRSSTGVRGWPTRAWNDISTPCHNLLRVKQQVIKGELWQPWDSKELKAPPYLHLGHLACLFGVMGNFCFCLLGLSLLTN